MLEPTRPKLSSQTRHKPRAAPLLFLVIEAGRPTGGSARFALDAVDEIVIGRDERRTASRELSPAGRRLRLGVPDPWMSRAQARITRRGAALDIADLGSSNGTIVDGVRVDAAPLPDGALVELGHTFFVVRRVEVSGEVSDVVDAAVGELGTATVLPPLDAQLRELLRVAPSLVPVVLLGPSGCGKEELATALHRASGRGGPLVAVNCGAIPKELVESELFGHRRGAFSGAVADKVGLIAGADHGTLLLDEIGDLPLAVQPALLRALEEHAVVPVGANHAVAIDFRVVCATHRDLEAMVARGEFREDLWARLCGFVFELPALARRREDLGTLVAHLLARLAPGREVALLPDAARALLRYDWPRNIRELAKVLEAALALAGDGEIDIAHLSRALQAQDVPAASAPDEDPQRRKLVAALREHGGNISAVARALGKHRAQIQRWMRRWGLRGSGDE